MDLIGIDRDGKLVVIELKKGALRGDVDFQSLKYVRTRHTGVETEFGSSSSRFRKPSGVRVSMIKTPRLPKFWRNSAMMSTT